MVMKLLKTITVEEQTKKTIKYNPMMIKSVHTDSSIKGLLNN